MKAALAVLAAVFKWAGIVLGGLLLLLLLLSFFPVRLDVEWKEGKLSAVLRYLFLRKELAVKRKEKKEPEKAEADGRPEAEAAGQFPSYDKDPLPPETAERPPEKPAEEPEKKEKAPKEKAGLLDLWDKVSMYFDPGTKAGRYLIRRVKVRDLHASLECWSSDAAVTGMLTGAKWAFLGNACAALNGLFGGNVSYGELKVTPCWTRDMARGEEAGGQIRLRPAAALGAGFVFLGEWLPRKLKKRKKTPSEA